MNAFIRRQVEYCYGADYIVGYGPFLRDNHHRPFECFDLSQIVEVNEAGLDVFRSYSDGGSNPKEGSTLLVWDTELYTDWGRQEGLEIANNPFETYAILEEPHHVILGMFHDWGLNPLSLATAKGRHYSFRVDKGKPEHRRLESIGRDGVRSDVIWHYTHGRSRMGRRWINMDEAQAFNGVGKLIEFLSHGLIRAMHGKIAVHYGDVYTGNRRSLSSDVSAYEAPIHMRDLRAPFASHSKSVTAGDEGAPIWRCIPDNVPAYNDALGHNGFSLSYDELMNLKMNDGDAYNYAKNLYMEIPEQARGLNRLMDAYEYSGYPLAEFHCRFDHANPEVPRYLRDNWEWNFESENWLSPSTMESFCRKFYDNNPETARKMATYAREKMEENHPNEDTHPDAPGAWRYSAYPAETKNDLWIRAYCGRIHCGL